MTTCQRCGTCCEKGGPGLHREDRHLVDGGRIPARTLFTIRRGEVARDNVKGTLSPVTHEIIKIKGKPGRWTCLFFDDSTKGCGIYTDRPLECRALNCRDTRQIERVYEHTRLNREDLFTGIEGLWDLIIDHETRCNYKEIRRLVDRGNEKGRLKQEEAILEILRYDHQIRQLASGKGGMDPQMLDFIFGRPLSQTIRMFDLDLMKKDGRYRLVPKS